MQFSNIQKFKETLFDALKKQDFLFSFLEEKQEVQVDVSVDVDEVKVEETETGTEIKTEQELLSVLASTLDESNHSQPKQRKVKREHRSDEYLE